METYILIIAVVVIVLVVYLLRKYKNKRGKVKADDPVAGKVTSLTTSFPVTVMKDGKELKGDLHMTGGLQVFDATGKCILDVTDSLTRILGIFETGTNYEGGTEYTSDALTEAYKYKNNVWLMPLSVTFPSGTDPKNFCYPFVYYSNGKFKISATTPDGTGKKGYVNIKFIYGTR